MKQKAKISVRSLLSYPFTLFWILTHTFFFGVAAFFFGCITHRFVVTQPYTKAHTPSYFRGFKCPYTCLFLYRKKNSKCPLFWYTYIRKKPFELSNIHTHPYIRTPNSVLRFCAQTLCSDYVLRFRAQILCSNSVLSFSSSSSLACWSIFSLHFSPGGDYLSRTVRCGGLSLVHSALRGIISCAQRAAGDYLSIFLVLRGIISRFFSYCGGLSPICLLFTSTDFNYII